MTQHDMGRATHFQNVGLKAMAAAETIEFRATVRAGSRRGRKRNTRTKEALLAEVDQLVLLSYGDHLGMLVLPGKTEVGSEVNVQGKAKRRKVRRQKARRDKQRERKTTACLTDEAWCVIPGHPSRDCPSRRSPRRAYPPIQAGTYLGGYVLNLWI